MDSNNTADLLKARAAVLKKPPVQENETDHYLHGTAFNLFYTTYFIESIYISEIQLLSSITPLPGHSGVFSGITNFRGKIIAVVNLAELLNMHTNAITNQNKIIFLEHDGIEFGILADEIAGNILVNPADLKKDTSSIVGDNTRLFHGISADKMLIINGAELITDNRLYINEV